MTIDQNYIQSLRYWIKASSLYFLTRDTTKLLAGQLIHDTLFPSQMAWQVSWSRPKQPKPDKFQQTCYYQDIKRNQPHNPKLVVTVTYHPQVATIWCDACM